MIKKILIVSALWGVSFAPLSGSCVQAYGVIKPVKQLPVSGILHFKEGNGLEVDGYFSRLEEGQSVVAAVWSLQKIEVENPICVGPHSVDRCVKEVALPVSSTLHLGEASADPTGYGEFSVRLEGVSLQDLRQDDLKIIIYSKDQTHKFISPHLVHQKFSFVEMRWIED